MFLNHGPRAYYRATSTVAPADISDAPIRRWVAHICLKLANVGVPAVSCQGTASAVPKELLF